MKHSSRVAIAIAAENRFEYSSIQTHQLHVTTHPIRAHIASLTISGSVSCISAKPKSFWPYVAKRTDTFTKDDVGFWRRLMELDSCGFFTWTRRKYETTPHETSNLMTRMVV